MLKTHGLHAENPFWTIGPESWGRATPVHSVACASVIWVWWLQTNPDTSRQGSKVVRLALAGPSAAHRITLPQHYCLTSSHVLSTPHLPSIRAAPTRQPGCWLHSALCVTPPTFAPLPGSCRMVNSLDSIKRPNVLQQQQQPGACAMCAAAVCSHVQYQGLQLYMAVAQAGCPSQEPC